MTELTPGEIRNGVLVGLDGYLFLHGGAQSQFDYLTGVRKPLESDIENFFDNISQRENYCKSKDIPYCHIVYPSKPTVMESKLPKPWQRKVKSLYLTRYARSTFRPQVNNVIYPRDILKKMNSDAATFRKLDTHNTHFSAHAIACMALKKFGITYDETKAFYTAEQSSTGDLSEMLLAETTEPVKLMLPYAAPFIFDNRPALPSNTGHICILHNPCASTTKRLLIFGDSFIRNSLDFFAPVFRDILYIRSALFQRNIAEMYVPDFIISANAERYLSKVESDNSFAGLPFERYDDPNYKPSSDFVAAHRAQLSFRDDNGRYEEWRNRIADQFFFAADLGLGRPNRHVKAIDAKAGSFISVGNDPNFVFSSVSKAAKAAQDLRFELVSSVASYATVYFAAATGDRSFSEARSIKLPVAVGHNVLSFSLPAARLANVIRIDPLAKEGEFKISNVSLS